jgi:hypothetical protein
MARLVFLLVAVFVAAATAFITPANHAGTFVPFRSPWRTLPSAAH